MVMQDPLSPLSCCPQYRDPSNLGIPTTTVEFAPSDYSFPIGHSSSMKMHHRIHVWDQKVGFLKDLSSLELEE